MFRHETKAERIKHLKFLYQVSTDVKSCHATKQVSFLKQNWVILQPPISRFLVSVVRISIVCGHFRHYDSNFCSLLSFCQLLI